MAQPSADIELITQTADLIVKYGFLGVGLVLTIAIAPLVYRIWHSKLLTSVTITFGLAFIVAWGALDLVQRYFPSWIASKRAFVNGVVLKVPNGYQVQIGSDLRTAGAAYLKRENDAENRELNSFLFLLVAGQSPNCLSVAINNNDPKSEKGSSGFNIAPIVDGDAQSDTDIIAVAQRAETSFQLRVWREIRGRKVGDAKVFNPLDDSTAGCTIGRDAGQFDWILPSAFAQSGTSARDLSVRLTSDDLFTRRDARIELSKQQNSVDMARQLLQSGNYRLELGALVALSIMPETDRKKLPPDLLTKIREYKNNKDATISETAARIEVPPR